MRAVARYALFQIPELALLAVVLAGAVEWFGFSRAAAWAIVALWLAKDAALFPFVRRAYETSTTGGADGPIGARAVVRAALDPEGWVQIGSESWRAEVSHGQAPVPPGAVVSVVSVNGLVLRVEPSEAGL